MAGDGRRASSPLADVLVHRESPVVRFWTAFGVAVLIWCLFAALTHSFVDMAFNRSCSPYPFARPLVQHAPTANPYPAPHDGTVHQCITASNWTDTSPTSHFPHSASAFLELPLDSAAIYLFTRGRQQSGHLHIVQSTEPTNTVGVQVLAAYHSRKALDLASVCRLERRPNQNGIGILTPESYSTPDSHQITFDVTVTFPAPINKDDALRIKSFETETSNYHQHIPDNICDTVFFDRLLLETANGNIFVKSVTAEDSLIMSSNGTIQGHFKSGSSIALLTANGSIQASVLLFNRENGKESELNMETSNSPIIANVDLVTRSGHGGIFNVHTRTLNAPVALDYTAMPLNAVLNSETSSSNARTGVKLHSAFEGVFEVATSNAAAVLLELPSEDPSGRGRRRAVTRRQESDYARGSVHWGEGRASLCQGRVDVSTTNGDVELYI